MWFSWWQRKFSMGLLDTTASSSIMNFRLFSVLTAAVAMSPAGLAFVFQLQDPHREEWPSSTTINHLQERHRRLDMHGVTHQRIRSSMSRSALFLSNAIKTNIADCESNGSGGDGGDEQEEGGTTQEESSRALHDLLSSSYQLMKVPERAVDYRGGQQHAIYGTLLGDGRIESYQAYRKVVLKSIATDNMDNNDNNTVLAVVKFGNGMNGHPGMVHGGIVSLVLDDVFGFGYEALGDVAMAVTANLTVDYRAPLPAGTQVVIAVQLEHREGRKLFWKAQVTSMDRNTVYAEAKSLFVIPREVS
jgi:acyl-coenzyme A thioesterase PaaI-like protein